MEGGKPFTLQLHYEFERQHHFSSESLGPCRFAGSFASCRPRKLPSGAARSFGVMLRVAVHFRNHDLARTTHAVEPWISSLAVFWFYTEPSFLLGKSQIWLVYVHAPLTVWPVVGASISWLRWFIGALAGLERILSAETCIEKSPILFLCVRVQCSTDRKAIRLQGDPGCGSKSAESDLARNPIGSGYVLDRTWHRSSKRHRRAGSAVQSRRGPHSLRLCNRLRIALHPVLRRCNAALQKQIALAPTSSVLLGRKISFTP